MGSGLKASRRTGGATNGKGINTYVIADAYGSNIFAGDPVRLSSTGFLVLAAAGDAAIGVFTGCSYVGADGTPVQDRYFPTGTTSTATPIDGVEGRTNAVAYVMDDPDATMTIEADAAVTAGMIGNNFTWNVVAGSTTTKQSGYTLDIASETLSADGINLRLVGLVQEPGNTFSSATPLVEVKWANHADKAAGV